ncbi:Outer membrane TonB-dependent transporter, utilization system for glycans and polysaccharides (PUL), SusC family [Bacteroides ovatus]|jgi:tonB-linked outer membrane protein, susC/ragA family|uniref:SusC/RagA family TonB-linked outer membrane protein n=1 Tax=Bacteroides TaxID=816 RepID=UPI000E7ED06F|nr:MULTISPECIES: SusC/RagA family TonB-linked outer membrane protein [Bacteroides]MCS3177410.1 SusC/RagA family TonB-linked outer membrane protein [Candidatus Bacteroides intestinigallinarum]RGN60759.1 SusC/RagA family TonB-linked outer membrane protein [Bacteroides sp. OM05-10AA]RGQ57406.1 SusC/RagA family TonB-linked outer membrane protein [Bacteroides sp. AF27-33]CAG9888872.1 Outer membrane TonB-dependent transporter, utilization system for glycans and polysaccharides (PUL), SusC family [Bac
MGKRIHLFLLALAIGVIQGAAQVTTVRGIVTTEEDGEPVIGASVIVKGTALGTVTDVNGRFELSGLPPSATRLLISYISLMAKEVAIAPQVSVTLKSDTHLLDEVVVTALGISREKKALGYTAQEVKQDALVQGKDNNLLNSLSGKIAGVRITNTQGDVGSSRIVIRGETSIAGENQPLFIVDGIPVDNSQLNARSSGRDFKNAIADLNPEDIKTLTVLKGPNAAALYGARAAHGAIVITTKGGDKRQKGIGITLHSSTQVSFVATLPEFQNLFGQGAGGRFSYVDGKGAGVNDGVDESWGPRLDIGLLIPQFDSPLDADGNRVATPWVSHPNNVRDYFRMGISTNNGISIARGDDKYQFRVGYNYEKQVSIVPDAGTNKTNISLNTDYHLAKWIVVGATANYIVYTAPSLPGSATPSGSNVRSNSPMLQFLWFGRQVDTNSLKADYTRNWNSSYYDNPFWSASYNTQSQERHRLIGDLHAEFRLTDGLNVRFRTSTDWYNDRRKSKVKWGSAGAGSPYGSYAEDAYTVKENNTEVLATYIKQLNKNWGIDALLGFNVRNKQYENNYQAAPRLAVADLYTLTNSRDPLTSSNDFYRLRQYGLYGSIQLDYRRWAFLNITGRNDWSSTLPVDNNSYFYPSVTASVLLSEAFGWRSKAVNYLKIRGGWSQVGADANPYQLATVFTSETAFNGNPLQSSSTIGMNPNLKPEKTSSIEAGFEAAFWDNRLYLDFTYYKTDSRNQILKLATTAASGYTSQVRNAGHIRNRGYEIQLGAVPIQTSKGFRWNLDLNYGANSSKVVKLDDEGLITSYQLYSSGIQILASVGEAYGTLFGTSYVRDANGNVVVDANGLPKISTTNKTLGKFTPDWTGGISNTFSYRSLSLSFLIDASVGGSIFSNTNKTGKYTGVLANTLSGRDAEHGGLWYYTDAMGNNVRLSESPSYSVSSDGLYYAQVNGQSTRVYQDGIMVEGVTESGSKNEEVVSAEKYYHRIYSIAEANVYDASYVKLREVALSYRLPRLWTQKLHLQEASVTLTGRNLWTIYKSVPNIDPESALTTGNAQGVEAYSLPTTRSFGVNLSVKF